MLYRLLVDLVVLLHLAFIAFVVAGGLLVLKSRRLAWIHLPCVGWGVLIEFGGWICPLTPLENSFRARAGLTTYPGGFIEHYLLPIIYPAGLTREIQIWLGFFVLMVNAGIYGHVLWLAGRRRSAQEGRNPSGNQPAAQANAGSLPLFDVYLFVDWSAANQPQSNRVANAIWLAECSVSMKPPETKHLPTRVEAYRYVLTRLLFHAAADRRVLVGFDFAYGYPAGFAAALQLAADAPPWLRIWQTLSRRVQDNEQNRNNRFAVASHLNRMISERGSGPFWGRPPRQAFAFLSPQQPEYPYPCDHGAPLARLRHCETRLRGVFSTWQLFGAGAVGGQTLTGIPYLNRLRYHPELAGMSRVWPFETGFSTWPGGLAGPRIVHAEVWPGVVRRQAREIQQQHPMLPDAAQVCALCEWARTLDRQGALGSHFAAPEGLLAAERRRCVQEEGWILGAP